MIYTFSRVWKVKDSMRYSAQQAGSVVVYTIVGVLLAVATIGAIVVAKNRGDQQITTRPSQPTVEQSDKKDNTSPKGADNENKEKLKESQKIAEDKAAREKAQAEAKKIAEEKVAAEKKAAEEKVAEKVAQAEAQGKTDGPMTRASGDQGAALPTTGPAEDLLGMVTGLVVIVGAGYLYYHFGQRR